MKDKILNFLMVICLLGLFAITYKTYNVDDTIDSLSGATPVNGVFDSIAGASEDEGDDD